MRRIAFVLALVCACDDSFVKGWLVDRSRVLGARVEAVTEPARATVAPGETARVSWLVARIDEATPALAWTFAVCAVADGVRPEPRCDGVLTSGSGTAANAIVPMEFVVPETPGTELVMLAAFCETGTPTLDAARFEASCPGGALLASARIRLAAAGPNRNPEMPPVNYDNAPMPEADCAVAAPGSKHDLTFTLRPEEREAMETLLVTHVVNGGELDRQYSALEADEAAPKPFTVPWTAPGDARQVDFYFILRDGRGGTGYVRRTVCVR